MKQSTISVYLNIIHAKGTNRAIQILKTENEGFKISFKRLIDLTIEPDDGFVNSPTKWLVKREHSKWAILCTQIILSKEAMELLHAMMPKAYDLQIYKDPTALGE